MSELVSLCVVAAAAAGAIISTIRGRVHSGQNYSVKKSISALITSVFTAFGIVNLVGAPEQLSQVGWVGLVLANLLLGYGVDQGISDLDK